MYNRFLDAIKALEVLIYVIEQEHDLRRIMKYLYFSDKLHLERYGRSITGDYYVKMPQGPVPSGAYDIVKAARGDDQFFEERIIKLEPHNFIQFKDAVTLNATRQSDTQYLSDSDIECLDETIRKLISLSDNELIDLGHKEVAWKEAEKNSMMKETSIIMSLSNGKEIIDYINA